MSHAAHFRREAERMAGAAMPAEVVARAIAYAIGQPPEVDGGSAVVRPAAPA